MNPTFPYVFTFYSYKGGVGRSMALLNAAYALSARGRHVLVVDMDLEAPGVSGYLRRNSELEELKDEKPKDILDLLWEVIGESKKGRTPQEIAAKLPPVSTYIRRAVPAKIESLKPKVGDQGRLDFITADDQRHYWRRLSEVGISGLPQECIITASAALNLYFKAQRFPFRPVGVEPFEEPLQTPYDYVLVDSRTGITEVGGLCVGPLADRLVVLTSLNDQNVQGTLAFLKEVGIETKARGTDAKPFDTADVPPADATAQSSLGPKPTILVASPVPNGEIDFKRKRIAKMNEEFGILPLRLSYHPQMAVMEGIFVRDFADEYLAIEYRTLVREIMARVNDHPAQLAQRVNDAWNKEHKTVDAIRAALRISSDDPDLGVALLVQLGNELTSSIAEEFQLDRRIAAFIAQARPENKPVALSRCASALNEQAVSMTGPAVDEYFSASNEKFAQAVLLRPDNHEAFNNWGVALSEQAKLKGSMPEGDRLFADSYAKFAEALRIKPVDYDVFNNWGAALSDQAKLKGNTPEGDRLFADAYAKIAEAMRLKPDNHEAFNNWGAALSDQAKLKGNTPEGDRLFTDSYAKFAEAVRIKPDKHEAFNNWGAALSDQAKLKGNTPEGDRLFTDSYAKLAEAVHIKPDDESAHFNIARVHSLCGRVKECCASLELWKKFNVAANKSQLDGEKEFDRVRTAPEFVTFRESLPD